MNFVDIEIILKGHNTTNKNDIISICNLYLCSKTLKLGTVFSDFSDKDNCILYYDVERIFICDSNIDTDIDLTKCHINWYVFALDRNGPQSDSYEDESGNDINLATQWVLPSLDLNCLWETLVYDNEIKQNLLRYGSTMMEFSDKGVNSNIISCNRVILLHGPPGTGKTSLCKALAQKLSIKLQKRYKQSVLIEINSHSLFSKWFSESGKLVTKMFTKIKEIVEDMNILVCVLIDEIESLAHAREQCMSGNEPSDSIKVVNAVLTQLDQLKHYPNVMILATSNMTKAIDIAFVDRADIKQYLGLPSKNAIYQIYYSCIEELLKTGILQSKLMMCKVKEFNIKDFTDTQNFHMSRYLMDISQQSVGLSGRTLRKIPLLAHSLFLEDNIMDLEQYFDAIKKAIVYEFSQREYFSKN